MGRKVTSDDERNKYQRECYRLRTRMKKRSSKQVANTIRANYIRRWRRRLKWFPPFRGFYNKLLFIESIGGPKSTNLGSSLSAFDGIEALD